nr:hypothetical protein [Alloacidobacterium dinghuense]
MSCVRICDGGKAYLLVHTGRIGSFGTKSHDAKMLSGFGEECGDERSSDALIPPCLFHVDAPDPANFRIGGEWIAIESAYGDQQALIEVAAEDLSGAVEAILCAGSVVEQRLDEVVAFAACLGLQLFHSRHGQLNLLD